MKGAEKKSGESQAVPALFLENSPANNLISLKLNSHFLSGNVRRNGGFPTKKVRDLGLDSAPYPPRCVSNLHLSKIPFLKTTSEGDNLGGLC